ncbi:MAG: lipopolysaccharide biosynthesis protein [Ideonella sp.]|nr:lipopolysaccharide biosynthesis protein [Ideonella sp.]
MSTRRALLFSFMDRYAGLTISIASSMVIARLLTPGELGVYSVAMVLLGFLQTLRDFGAGQYLVQERELDSNRIRAVWTIQLVTGILFACIAFLAANPVAKFYADMRIEGVMQIVALTFLVNPFGSLSYAWLTREMRFDSLAIMRFSSNSAGAIISMILAWQGYGVASLAMGGLGSTFVGAAMGIIFRPSGFPWLPGLSELRRVFSFSATVSVQSLLNTLSAAAPDLLLGKLQTMTDAGLFSRAAGLVNMFTHLFADAVHSVAFGALAREARGEGQVAELFMKATLYMTTVGWTFLLALVVLAEPLVMLFYGDQWGYAVPLVRWLGVAAIVAAPAMFCGTTLLAMGRSKESLRATAIDTFQRLTFCSFGAAINTSFLAACVVASTCITLAIWLAALRRHMPFRYLRLAAGLFTSGQVALFSTAPLILIAWYTSMVLQLRPLLVLGLCTLVGTLAFLLGLKLCSHPILDDLVKFLTIARARSGIRAGRGVN